MRHTLRIGLGILLVVVGIAGLLLPIMPGWIFVIPGLLILGDYFPPIRRLVDYVRRKFKDAEEGFRKSKSPDDAGEPASTSPEPPDLPAQDTPPSGPAGENPECGSR